MAAMWRPGPSNNLAGPQCRGSHACSMAQARTIASRLAMPSPSTATHTVEGGWASPAASASATAFSRGGQRSVAVAADTDWAEWYPTLESESPPEASTSRPSSPDNSAPRHSRDVPPGLREPDRPWGDPPVSLYEMTFEDAKSCRLYFAHLRDTLEQYKDLEEFEHNMVLALLREGHPQAQKKEGPGIVAFQVRPMRVKGQQSNAFFFLRTDGSFDDFSTRKCIAKLFPNSQKPVGSQD